MSRKRGGTRDAGRVSRHTARVRHLRLAVPALAAGLVFTYAISATPPRVDREFAEQFSAVESGEDGVKLARPRYSGEDLSGRPFEVAATSATRAADDENRVGLDRPEARTVGADGRETNVRALEGVYDRAARRIDLSRDVELTQGDGNGVFRLLTDQAQVDLERQVVTSETEVRGQGAEGTVRADRGTLYQNEDRVVLEGGVEITLEPTAPHNEAIRNDTPRGEASEDDPEG